MSSEPDRKCRGRIFCTWSLALLAFPSACSSQASKSFSATPPANLPTASNKATFASDGTISRAPNTVKHVENVLPGELSSVKRWTQPFANPRDEQFHVWDLFGFARSRTLQLDIRKLKNILEAKEDLLYERAKMANYSRITSRERLVTGSPRPVKGLGGECFSFPIKRNNAAPISGGDGSRYSVSGVRMYCRVGNVAVSIQWEGMDYPGRGVIKRGVGLTYGGSEKQAIGIMRPIIFSLTPER
ncbi:hypothetical protein ACFY4C_37250 [Actinomadura viridis]|uniref:hypothetical protein n=1 Tax=Actinomadura viridis TaxID=58110 RepID=UPI00367F81CE